MMTTIQIPAMFEQVSKNVTRSRSGVQSSVKPTVTAGSNRRQIAVNKVNIAFSAAVGVGTQPSSSSAVGPLPIRAQATTRTGLKESPNVLNRSVTEVGRQRDQRPKPVSSTDLLAILSCAPGPSRWSPTRSSRDKLALNTGSSHRSVAHQRESRTSSAGMFDTERVLNIPSLQENQLSLSGSSLSSSFWRQESSFVTSDFQSDYRNYASSHGTLKLQSLTRRSQPSETLMNKLSGRLKETVENKV